jgi:hypothetical protein
MEYGRRAQRGRGDREVRVIAVAPPPPNVHAVWHLGSAAAAATDAWTLIGQDGGQSIDLGDEVLFVFADTLLAKTSALAVGWPEARWPIQREQGRFLANCCARGPHGRLPTALASLEYVLGPDGWPAELLPATPAERFGRVRFWPEHGVAIDGRVYLYYLGIEHTRPGSTWGFRNLGTGLAVLDPHTGVAERLSFNGDWRLWPAGESDPHGGVQVLRVDDYIYVFGSCRDGYGATARVARVRPDAIADPAAYEYLASPEPVWSHTPAEACSLGVCGHEFSVSRNAYLDGYLMSYIEPAGRTLFMRRGRHPWGPYSDPVSLGLLPIDARNDSAAMAFEHPRYASGDGRTVTVSYCQANFVMNGLVGVRFA